MHYDLLNNDMQKPGFNIVLLQVRQVRIILLILKIPREVFRVAVFNRIDTVTHVAQLNEKDSFLLFTVNMPHSGKPFFGVSEPVLLKLDLSAT